VLSDLNFLCDFAEQSLPRLAGCMLENSFLRKLHDLIHPEHFALCANDAITEDIKVKKTFACWNQFLAWPLARLTSGRVSRMWMCVEHVLPRSTINFTNLGISWTSFPQRVADAKRRARWRIYHASGQMFIRRARAHLRPGTSAWNSERPFPRLDSTTIDLGSNLFPGARSAGAKGAIKLQTLC